MISCTLYSFISLAQLQLTHFSEVSIILSCALTVESFVRSEKDLPKSSYGWPNTFFLFLCAFNKLQCYMLIIYDTIYISLFKVFAIGGIFSISSEWDLCKALQGDQTNISVLLSQSFELKKNYKSITNIEHLCKDVYVEKYVIFLSTKTYIDALSTTI